MSTNQRTLKPEFAIASIVHKPRKWPRVANDVMVEIYHFLEGLDDPQIVDVSIDGDARGGEFEIKTLNGDDLILSIKAVI